MMRNIQIAVEKSTEAINFTPWIYFAYIIDVFLTNRYVDLIQIYCTKFSKLARSMNVAPTVAVDLRFTAEIIK